MNKKLILVVEDDMDIRETLRDIFEDEGYEVICSENGQVGLEVLRSTSRLPNLILLDLMMPVMDGFAFRARLKADEILRQIPVIVMSADGRAQDYERLLDAAELVKKPLGVNDLLDLIRRHI